VAGVFPYHPKTDEDEDEHEREGERESGEATPFG
jgi:hypothetical protein